MAKVEKPKLNNGKGKAAKPVPAAKTPPPPVARLFRRIDWIIMGIVFVLIWAIYLYTLAPELTLEDSGELCTGSYYAGIPHPPGYPFWAIYSWFWTAILPVGNVAWRVEVGESFGIAMGCGMLALMVSRGSSMLIEGIEELRGITRQWESAICMVSGFVVGLMVGLDGFVWGEADVINRISVFAVPWLILVLLMLMRWMYAPHQRRYLYLAFFFYGICATIHQTLLLSAIGIEAAITLAQPKVGRNLLLGNSIFYVAGLMLKALVPALDHMSSIEITLFHIVGVSSIATYLWLIVFTKESVEELLRDVAFAGIWLFLASIPSVGSFGGFLSLVSLVAFIKFAWDARKKGLEIFVAIFCFILWCLGVSFYLYEPIAGMTVPPMQWGYPRTVEGFFHALSRGQYETAHGTNILQDPMRFVNQLWYLIHGLSQSFSWVFLFVGLLPFLFLLKMQKRERGWIIGLTAIYFCIAVLLVILLDVTLERSSADLNEVFFTASHAVFGIMIGYGLTLMAAYMATHYAKFRRWAILSGFIVISLALYCLTEAAAKLYIGPGGEPSHFTWPFITIVCLAVSVIPFTIILVQKNQETGGIVLTAISAIMGMLLHSFPWQIVTFVIVGYGLALSVPVYRWRVGLGGFTALVAAFVLPLHLIKELTADKSSESLLLSIVQSFAQDQYGLPIIANLILVAMPIVFVISLLIYRNRGPVLILLGLCLIMPVYSGLSHWYKSEQRNHWFGYWFGHDMFTPPFGIYPEMTRNTILFGGTDPGRFCPTYIIFCESFIPHSCQPKEDQHFDRRDVYIITQNALADGTYLDYLRSQYNRSKQIDPPFFSRLFRYAAATVRIGAPGSVIMDGIEEGQGDTGNALLEGICSLLDTRLDKPLAALGAHIEKRRRAEGVYPPVEIYIPSPDDLQQCYDMYREDFVRRAELGQLQPGEGVRSEDNHMAISGQVSVMKINGLLCKVIFDHNPTNEFFVEESFPLDWMYPYETPFGIIMEIHRNPLPELPDDVFKKDHEFWGEYSKRFIGNWITYDTSIQQIADFVEKVYLQGNFTGFKGDRKFVRDDDAQKAFSKLRSSQAGMYAWRLGPQCPAEYRQKTEAAQQALIRETDFAFKQAFAFCPYSPEAVLRYVINFLAPLNRIDDALVVTRTCLKFDPYNGQAADLLKSLESIKNQSAARVPIELQLQQMEAEEQKNPADFPNTFQLADFYFQLQQTNRAVQLLRNAIGRFDQALTNPNIRYPDVAAMAQIAAQLGNLSKLEIALQKLVSLAPEQPEPRYDLAALYAILGKTSEALQNLRTTLDLNAKRLATNPAARNLAAAVRTDHRFDSIRNLPDFQKLVPPN